MILDDSSLPLKGRAGNMVIYVTKKGKRIVRKKGGPTAKQMKKGKNYATARKNGTEFGYASRIGRVLRDKFSPLLQLAPDGDFNNRLTGQLRKLIQQDTKNELGSRRLTNASLATLPCIYLNDQCEADLVTVTVKEARLTIHSNPKEIKKYINDLKGKDKPTHFQVFSLLLPYDTNYKVKFEPLEKKESPLIPVAKKTAALSLEYELPVFSHLHARLHAVAIVFYQEKTGDFIMLGNKSLNGGWIEGSVGY